MTTDTHLSTGGESRWTQSQAVRGAGSRGLAFAFASTKRSVSKISRHFRSRTEPCFDPRLQLGRWASKAAAHVGLRGSDARRSVRTPSLRSLESRRVGARARARVGTRASVADVAVRPRLETPSFETSTSAQLRVLPPGWGFSPLCKARGHRGGQCGVWTHVSLWRGRVSLFLGGFCLLTLRWRRVCAFVEDGSGDDGARDVVGRLTDAGVHVWGNCEDDAGVLRRV